MLGWSSVGLGLAQIAMPRRLGRFTGVDLDGDHAGLIRAISVREISCGIGLLAGLKPAALLWSRVAGDAMDLSLLGAALAADDAERARVAASAAGVVGITAVDVFMGAEASRGTHRSREHRVRRAITVNAPADRLYLFWRDFRNLPRVMDRVESVQTQGDRRSHWQVAGPGGKSVEWDAEITADRPNELIAWRSLDGADVRNEGSVRFQPAPGGRGTELTVELLYEPPAGGIGALVARVLGREPGQEISADLRTFKQVIETGERVRSDATLNPGPHPAQPSPVGAGI